jgi:phosphoenolpyruvate carboxykinase (GTP)
MEVHRDEVLAETGEIQGHFAKFGDRLPAELERQRKSLEERAAGGPAVWRPAT